MTSDGDYRDSPEWRRWAEENKRRSEAMTDAVHLITRRREPYDQDEESDGPDGGDDVA